ncbi:MAG: hypothetical protein FWD79_08530 [Desulfobulbus sp.]|nr:hypothetical protein [Desulfobulbus sp.]
MEELSGQAAWVLLGEPGAGKSEAFRQEAKEDGGEVITIAEFLSDARADVLDPMWREKTLYLDGLDETRASGGSSSTLCDIRAYLKKLGSPRFRIACRAADWFGSTDREVIADISQDGQFGVYRLDPLHIDDIKEILRQNHGISDPETFVENAREFGIDGLLDNPQTLRLLAEAIHGGQWPTTRLETFELACRKLAQEDSKPHRNLARAKPISVKEILAAAGQLCAVLLLSGKSGIALDQESVDEQFPLVDDFVLDHLAAARLAISRKLFRPASGAQERVVPSHRSIAEFLAADWLAKRIGHEGLPLGRVLNLLLGLDERTVAGLRGLYGWLALCCKQARRRLIDADPLTVVVYGDAKPMSLEDKKLLLAGLQQEAEALNHYHYRWKTTADNQFGALADKRLTSDFATILGTTGRDNTSQSKLACVLDILSGGEPIPGLEPMIRSVVFDDAWRLYIRLRALETWLKYPWSTDEVVALLDALSLGRDTADNDDLIGFLLIKLYPRDLPAEKLFRYLHPLKVHNVVGGFYRMFWRSTLPEKALDSDLPILLDQLAERADLVMPAKMEFDFDWSQMLGALISRGLQVYGDKISDGRLYAWLGIGIDGYGEINRNKEHHKTIVDWLAIHPERYKAVLALCYKHCEASGNIGLCFLKQETRLHNALLPSDIGLWHLEQASLTAHDGLAKSHFGKAVGTLFDGYGCTGLSLEKIEAWGEANPKRRHWWDQMRAWEITEWHQKAAVRKKTHEIERSEQRRNKTTEIPPHLEAIRNGTAWPGIMHELAGVWLNHYLDTHGDTIEDRFGSYCDNGSEVLEAAESGFFRCPERDDLPSVAEIINLNTSRREHFIRKPCLVGMELRWRRGESFVDCLSEEQLRRMVAFRLTYGADQEPAWFSHFVQTRPGLVAEVLIAYASAAFKSKQDYVHSLYALANDDTYRAVAELALMPLLTSFPVRIKSTLLPYLKDLLRATMRYFPEQLQELLKRKLTLKGIDVPQKVYWLTAGMLLDPAQYELVLWRYIGKARVRTNHLHAFVSERFGYVDLSNNYDLSAVTLGRMIELLTPHAELESRSGEVTEPMRIGESIYAMVTRLGALASQEAAQEIGRLLAAPPLSKLKHALENARHQLRLNQRENAFRFLSPQQVAAVLYKRGPVDVADLAALTLDFLDQIADELRHDNDDGFRAFWNVENKKPTGKREENLCRDALLTRLRALLSTLGIDCQPEGDYPNDKRADIRLSCLNKFELPIEIKLDNHRELWGAARTQLMAQYASATKASGHGIYLVLWFGKDDLPAARDGKKKPVSPEELRDRLEALLDQEERSRIFVRVLNVSWPNNLFMG